MTSISVLCTHVSINGVSRLLILPRRHTGALPVPGLFMPCKGQRSSTATLKQSLPSRHFQNKTLKQSLPSRHFPKKKKGLSLYAPSIVPNIESSPSVNSMEKNMIAQNVDPGNDSTASGYTYDRVVVAIAVGCW